MRIAFTGAGGTGKTTLLKEINKYLNITVIKEGIRSWLAFNNINDFKDMNIDDIKRMQSEVMYSKIKEEQSLSSFLSDRTTIDNLVYALRWISSVTFDNDEWYYNYLSDARDHAENTYDIIFVLPWGIIPLDNDGTRSGKKWYQYMIQSLIEHEISKLKNPYIHIVKSVSLKDRVDECINVYNSCYMQNNVIL